jgi:hypothetical protein
MLTMKPLFALTLVTILHLACFAQIDFQPGYYIRNDGTKISCLIKDHGWVNNPMNIVCKSSPEAAPVTIGMESILEFGVGSSKYQRFDVDVEISGDAIDELSSSPVPKYRHETALLKLLVEGRANLYLYQKKRLTRYFFRLNGAAPTPLVSKQYRDRDGFAHANQEYIKLLADSLNCSAPDFPDPTMVRFEVKSLTRFFVAYNNCVRSAYTDYWTRAGKSVFHLHIRPGVDLSGFTVTDNSNQFPSKHSYGSEASFRIGVEGEFILPVNRNKWSVILEPVYRSYHSSSGGPDFNVDFKAIQLQMGARYYLFISSQTKLFLTAALCSNFSLNSTVQNDGSELNTLPHFGGSFSGGLRYKDRLGIELNYAIPQNILDNYIYFRSSLSTTSLIVSYRIL